MERRRAVTGYPSALARDEISRGAVISRVTATGRGAIAVLRVEGPRAIQLVDSAFRQDHGARLADSRRGVLRLGHIGEGPGDQVVAVVLDESPPAVEVQCHGGDTAVSLVVQALQTAGAVNCDASYVDSRSSGDPIADRARVDLVRAPTVVTAEILLDQVHGALREELVRLARWINEQPDRALAALDTLIGRAQVGLRLIPGMANRDRRSTQCRQEPSVQRACGF